MKALLEAVNALPRPKMASIIRQHTGWIRRLPAVVDVCKLALDSLRDAQRDYLRGFPSDGFWIDFITGTAEQFSKSLEHFNAFMRTVEDAWATAKDLPLLAKSALKSYLRGIQRLKMAVAEYLNSVRLFSESVIQLVAVKGS